MKLIQSEKFLKSEFDKRLRFETEPVGKINETLRNAAIDLLGLMYQNNGIGLAANQAGLKIRLCVMDPAWMHGRRMPVVMFNPEFVECGDEIFEAPEGCLSFPDMGLMVPRFRNVKVRFTGLDGKEYIISDDNSLLSIVIQHEIDHLDGVLFIDRIKEKVDVIYKDTIMKGD
jgi:peptide deformylase